MTSKRAEREVPWQPAQRANWQLSPVKRHFDILLGKMLQPEKRSPEDVEVPYLKAQHIQWDKVLTEDLPTMWATPGEVSSLQVRKGDLLVCEGGEVGRAAIVAEEPPKNCIIQNALHLVRPKQAGDVRFLRYVLQHATSHDWLNVLCNRATIAHFTAEKFSDMWIWVPPLPKQCAIADYLDRETSRLDNLIAEQERLLSLLVEKRRALITQAVTRGLNPNVPMRDSGVEWLGEIPNHWGVERLRYLASEPLMYGANEAALETDPSFPRFVRITDISEDGSLRSETFKSLPSEIAEPYLLREGDVLLARSGATVGKTFIYRKEWGKACFAGYLIRLRCNRDLLLPDFLFAFTQSHIYWSQIRGGTIQATIQNFSAEKYGGILLPLPPPTEQHSIVVYRDGETAKIDELSSTVKKNVKLLQERRAALISAAVTGQIHV